MVSMVLMILWEEHRAEHIDGHGYSRFCELYGEWRRRLSPTMRQTHVAGAEPSKGLPPAGFLLRRNRPFRSLPVTCRPAFEPAASQPALALFPAWVLVARRAGCPYRRTFFSFTRVAVAGLF
jgi:hypothetical protein